MLLDEFPLEDILDDSDSYAEAGVCSPCAFYVCHERFLSVCMGSIDVSAVREEAALCRRHS